jgi:integrase/recombinase XerD
MATTTHSAALVPVAPVFINTERLALAGFLAGYSGLTREAYELDLRQYASWCQQHHLRLFQARRADIECFARDLEACGRARATITRRLCTVVGFYRYAVEENMLDHSPAAHVRRRGWTTSHTPPDWTATNSALCWWPPGSAHRPSMH